jgi:hypothetical protein
MKLRQVPPPAPPDGLTDEQAAALERAISRPGWRLEGPEFAGCQEAAVRLLADRWRRRTAGAFQGERPAR